MAFIDSCFDSTNAGRSSVPLGAGGVAIEFVLRCHRRTQRDGADVGRLGLSTDVYRPDAPGRFPVILVRDPYSNGSTGGTPAEAHRWASRGYVYLRQDVRGRFDSEGAWIAFANEFADGYDALQWAGTQPWSNGSVAMRGVSYLAYDQWQAASRGNPFLKTIIPTFSPARPLRRHASWRRV